MIEAEERVLRHRHVATTAFNGAASVIEAEVEEQFQAVEEQARRPSTGPPR